MSDDYEYLKTFFEKKEEKTVKPVKAVTVEPPKVESVEEVKNTVVETVVEDSGEKKKFKDSKINDGNLTK